MPITENGFEYTIPDEYLNMIDLEFLKVFRQELFKLKYITLDSFYQDTLMQLGGTSGWYVCFKVACEQCNKIELLKYYNSLPYYDSDLFDGEIGELLVSNKLVMNNTMLDIISKELDIKSSEIKQCLQCGKYDFKSNMTKNSKDELLKGYYVCIHCDGFDHMEYYRQNLSSLTYIAVRKE